MGRELTFRAVLGCAVRGAVSKYASASSAQEYCIEFWNSTPVRCGAVDRIKPNGRVVVLSEYPEHLWHRGHSLIDFDCRQFALEAKDKLRAA